VDWLASVYSASFRCQRINLPRLMLRCSLQPNIIRVVDTFQTCSMIYIVMELLRGGDLFDRIIEKERYAVVLMVLSCGVPCCAALRALPSAAFPNIRRNVCTARFVRVVNGVSLHNESR
jgi:serine/threonine protein kinase